MKGKTLIIAGITAAVIIICFVVYGMCSNIELESEQIAVVFPMDEMVSVEMFEETINDLYKETLVKSETAGEESDIQEMAEVNETSSDLDSEEILLTDESIENPSGGEDLTATQPALEGGGSDNTGGGNGLTPEQQAYLDSIFGGGGGQLPTGSFTGDAPNGPAWTMAQ